MKRVVHYVIRQLLTILGITLVSFAFTPDDITKQSRLLDELNFAELTERVRHLKEDDVDTIRWKVARYFKVSFTFTDLIVVLFGIPLVVM